MIKLGAQEIPIEVESLISDKFTVIGYINFLHCFHDYNLLTETLLEIKKDYFDSNERIIVDHQDTDFYTEYCSVGIHMYNFFAILENLHFPAWPFIFYTNHFGLEKEINHLCKHLHSADRPTVLESFITTKHYNNQIPDCSFDPQSIVKNGICMMNMKRSHRHAVYNLIKNFDSQSIAISATKVK